MVQACVSRARVSKFVGRWSLDLSIRGRTCRGERVSISWPYHISHPSPFLEDNQKLDHPHSLQLNRLPLQFWFSCCAIQVYNISACSRFPVNFNRHSSRGNSENIAQHGYGINDADGWSSNGLPIECFWGRLFQQYSSIDVLGRDPGRRYIPA